MRDVNALSNRELDELAERTDATQGQAVLGKVYEYLGRYVVYPSVHACVAHAIWIMHTHLMNRWDSTPRIAFLSVEKASGKSRALEATESLVPSPVTAVNVSPAYLFRKVGAEEGATILYDEIDTVFGDRANNNEEIRALLNAGHRRGAVAGRCAGQAGHDRRNKRVCGRCACRVGVAARHDSFSLDNRAHAAPKGRRTDTTVPAPYGCSARRSNPPTD
jgi:hypothetical protein